MTFSDSIEKKFNNHLAMCFAVPGNEQIAVILKMWITHSKTRKIEFCSFFLMIENNFVLYRFSRTILKSEVGM